MVSSRLGISKCLKIILMDSLKKSNDMFNNDEDLKTKIEKLERKVIPNLENTVHQMNHKMKVLRRQSHIFGSASCVDVSRASDEKEKIKNLTSKLENISSELRSAEKIIKERDAEIDQKNEEIRILKRQGQKMVDCFKRELAEKDQAIRELNDEVVDLRGQIRVAVRVREHENGDSSNFTVKSLNEIMLQQNGQSNFFHFEHIFLPATTQNGVFNDIKELIMCALHGKNVCLIAFGPTGSGKTFTMRGYEGDLEGVIPRAIKYILKTSKEDSAVIGWKYNFDASFIEVYNEEVFDLLDNKKKLDVKITGPSTIVVGLKKIPIKDLSDVANLLDQADSQRSVASTACNLDSSRSHALFQIYIDGVNTSGETVKCCLNLVDLAGSERAKESLAKGKQFSELKNINQSLSTLKKVIRAQMNKMPHVPYRDSKLTILLREYLGAGSSKTMFIAHVNICDVSETKRTLDFTADLRSTHLGKATVQTGQGLKA